MRGAHRRMNWMEVEAMTALVAEAHRRTGRNPTEAEIDAMIITARAMAADGAAGLQ